MLERFQPDEMFIKGLATSWRRETKLHTLFAPEVMKLSKGSFAIIFDMIYKQMSP